MHGPVCVGSRWTPFTSKRTYSESVELKRGSRCDLVSLGHRALCAYSEDGRTASPATGMGRGMMRPGSGRKS